MPVPGALLNARILVIDDQDADARLIEAMLSGNGYRSVAIANDPRAAVALHLAAPFDLVILDVFMPGMNGFEALHALHEASNELPVPVIMVTAEPEHIKRALEEGARDFIGKPVPMAELLSRVRNALELGYLLRDAKSRGMRLEETLQERTIDLADTQGRYRALVEQSIAGIYIVEDGRFTYANPRLCEWLGYTADELRDIDTVDLVMEEDRERLLANRARRDAGDASAVVATYRMLRRDGRVLHLSFDARLIEQRGRKVLFGIAQDVTSQRLAQDELRAANQRLRTLSDRILAIQEEERRRISRELHDDLGQSLVALDIGLHRLREHVGEPQRALLDECVAVAGGVREKMREISVELHPPHLDQLGLQDALRWLVARHREMTGLEIDYRFSGDEAPRVAPTVEAACYRICQEALTNATRHAGALRIAVELVARSGRLIVRVSDDGAGFDHAAQKASLVTSGSMGLIGMEERARLAGGELELRTAPGAGTCVSARFALDARTAESVGRRERV